MPAQKPSYFEKLKLTPAMGLPQLTMRYRGLNPAMVLPRVSVLTRYLPLGKFRSA